MKKILMLILLLLTINIFAQSDYEKGYFINLANQRIECNIKNNDWKDTPKSISYKLFENDKLLTISVNSIIEFGIYNNVKFIKRNTEIDKSSEVLAELSEDKNTNLEKEDILLRVLIEGKATLYSYEKNGLKRFFYNIDDQPISPLIYKKYQNRAGKIGYNEKYKQQLFMSLKCADLSTSDANNLEYRQVSLVKYFLKYNECFGSEIQNYDNDKSKTQVNINIRPGVNSTSLSIEDTFYNPGNIDFDNEIGFRLGLEFELILPYNKNKWAILVEPTYQHYNSAVQFNNGEIEADIKSIELPIGVRHYLIMNDYSKFFLNGLLVMDFNLNSRITFSEDTLYPIQGLKPESKSNFALGLGYKHKDKLTFELRYFSNRNILNSFQSFNSDYKTVAFIVGYRIF